jgi:hypothetical protein
MGGGLFYSLMTILTKGNIRARASQSIKQNRRLDEPPVSPKAGSGIRFA